MGFWNEQTQQALLETHVSIGGLGGAGYMAATEMARMGIQHFSLADPEGMDDTNIVRVPGAKSSTLGVNKAEVCRDEILDILDQKGVKEPTVRIYTEGVNTENVNDFMHDAHLVLDATELSMPELGTMICREARKPDIMAPVLNGEYVAYAGQVTSFNPGGKATFERIMGIKGGEKAPLDEVAEQQIATDRFLAYLPPYGDLATLAAIDPDSARLLAKLPVFRHMQPPEAEPGKDDIIAPMPANVIGAGVAAQLIVAEVLKHTRARVGEKGIKPTFAPSFRWYDAYTGKSGSTHHPTWSFYRHLAPLIVKNAFGLNEPASYSYQERSARGDKG